MVSVLTPYQDLLVFLALKNIESVDNYSGKSGLSAKLLNMAALFLESPYTLMHRSFIFFQFFFSHAIKKNKEINEIKKQMPEKICSMSTKLC